MLSLNVCGVKSKFLSVDFVNFIQDFDVICLCETKCDDTDMINVKKNMENIGFDIVFKNRSKLSRFKSGCLLIATKKNASFKCRHISNNYNSFLSVKVDRGSVDFGRELVRSCVYIPPSHSRYGREDHFDELDDFLLTYSYDDYVHVLCGDFNAHTLTMSDVPSDTVGDLVSAEVPQASLTDFGITETRAN